MPKQHKEIKEEEQLQEEVVVKPKKLKKIKKAAVKVEKEEVVGKKEEEEEGQNKTYIPAGLKKLKQQKQKQQPTISQQPSKLPPNSDIFVSGIPYESNQDQLRQLFQQCGTIELIKLPRYQDSGRCRGYAILRFSTAQQSLSALSRNGVTLGTRYLKVQKASGQKLPEQSKQQPPIGCKTIFVKNLPYDSTEETIRELFSKCGKIAEVRMVFDAYHKHFKGFCYIDYASPSSLKGGLKMHGSEYQGRRLIVQFSATAPRKGYKGYRKQENGQEE